METTRKRIPKDFRASLIAEYEQNPDKELSDPRYYVIKDKNGKLQVRRKRSPKKETAKSESDSADVPLTEEQKQEAEKAKAPKKEKKEKTL